MDKDLHDIDDIFNKAQQRYTEEPSEAAWEKIGAVLDKDDAEKYKKRFIGWKRIAIVLLLLLSGLMIYEAGIITNGKEGIGVADKNITLDSVAVNTQPNAEDKSAENSPRKNKREVPPFMIPAHPNREHLAAKEFIFEFSGPFESKVFSLGEALDWRGGTHSRRRLASVIGENKANHPLHTSSGGQKSSDGLNSGRPSRASGYSKTFPSKLRMTTRSALRLRTYSGFTGTLPPPPGASITYCGTA